MRGFLYFNSFKVSIPSLAGLNSNLFPLTRNHKEDAHFIPLEAYFAICLYYLYVFQLCMSHTFFLSKVGYLFNCILVWHAFQKYDWIRKHPPRG